MEMPECPVPNSWKDPALPRDGLLGNRLIAAPLRLPLSALPFLKRPGALWRLIGPLQVEGDCLEPIFGAGQLVFFDPTVEPAHLDFVLVEFDRELVELTRRGYAERPDLAPRGDALHDVSVKQLQIIGGRPFIVARDGALPVYRGTRILGVMRHYGRRPKRQVTRSEVISRIA